MATLLQPGRSRIREYIDRKLIERDFVSQVFRKIRRSYISLFHKEEALRSIAKRKGECHRCGSCCELVFRCPFLGKDADQLPYCRAYGDLRPTSCHMYPFDEIDSEVEQCGFYFGDKPNRAKKSQK